MNDTIMTRKKIASDAGASLQSSNGHDEADVGMDHAPAGARPLLLGRRGPSRSWLPGIWDDPF